MPTSQKIDDILLWAPMGAGLQYSGVGMSAHRLYAAARNAELFEGSLVHAWPDQQGDGVFQREIRLGSVRGSSLGKVEHLLLAEYWLRRYASRFSVFHGLSAYQPTLQPALLAQRLGLPAIVKIASHEGDLADKKSLPSQILRLPARRRQNIRRLSGVVATSREIADFLLSIEVPTDRIHRIPNGVDCSRFQPLSPQARIGLRRQLGLPDRPTVVFTGTVVPRKRPHLLIEALDRLRSQGDLWQLVVCGPAGDSVYDEQLRREIADRQMGDNVAWVGITSSVETWLQASDVYCLPSEREGMPNGVLEAMACGLPVLGTAISGTDDLVVNGKSGFLVDPSANAIASALSRYGREPSLAAAHGEFGRRRAEDNYSLTQIARRYYDLFTALKA